MKIKTLYEEVYVAPGLAIKAAMLPTLPSAAGFGVTAAHILKAGRALVDGQEREYQVVKIFLVQNREAIP